MHIPKTTDGGASAVVNIEIAGIRVSLDNKYRYIETIARPYLTEEPTVLTVSADEDEIKHERGKLSVSAGYAESVVMYSKIAEQLYKFDAFVMHTAAVEVDSVTYLVTARSGVGKTTHVGLWLDAFGGRARIINGDKPIIRKINGEFYAAGTPWCGKERLGCPDISKIKAIALLERSAENSAVSLSAADAAEPLVGQLYMPKSPISIASSLGLLDELLKTKKIIKLKANMDISAAHIAYRAMCENSEARTKRQQRFT